MIGLSRALAALLLATAIFAAPTATFAGVFVGIGIGGGGIGISVGVAPPPLPVYEQPPCLVADSIWTPGYWAYGPYGYYWVPGTWVEAPEAGYLWTPGYWGYGGGEYAWHAGYWGRHVGFYGGVNYGFGYGGYGYDGGRWNGDHFRYNTAYTNVDRTTIRNVYVDRTIVNTYGGSIDRTSYNGGEHGLRARPTPEQIAYRDERHVPVTPVQRQHMEAAAQNRNFLASVNHGRPSNAAVPSPLGRENRPAGSSRASGATDPFSRFDRNSPSYAGRSTGDAPARFDRNTPSYARTNASAADAFSRFDRNAPSRSRNSETSQRDSDGETRGANAYHPQASSRSERSYGAAATRYHAEPAYRSHTAPGAQRRSEPSRSEPSHAEHGEGHHSESNRREH